MRSQRASLLPWIIAFEAFKSVTLTTLAIVLLTPRHADPVDVPMRFALAVHLPLTSRLFDRALALVNSLTITRQTALAITAPGYAALMAMEGVALYQRRQWARWFTIIATSSLIPIEVYEIVRGLHPIRVFVLLANVAIVIYLVRRKELFETN